MSWQVVRLADAKPQPWRNGGGSTRELLALPSAADWSLRLSVAEVESDGPFSAFEGVERWFAVLGGAGVDLDIDGARRRVTASGAPLKFDGGARTQCTLVDGATQDFNLMVRGRHARMERVAAPARMHAASRALVAVYAQSPARLDGLDLDEGSLAWQVVGASRSFGVEAADALWMEVAP